MKHRKFTEEEVLFLQENYSTKGAKYCAKILNRSKDVILQKAINLKLQRDFWTKKVEISKFKNIDSPEISYILGFLWADGSISDRSICLEINKEDFNNINPLFQSVIEWSIYYRPKRGNDQLTATMTKGDTNFVNYLKTLDYKEKSIKSPSKILNIIPKKLHHYFWRGFCDGDGHIRVDKKGRYYVILSGSYDQDWSDLILILNKLNIEFRFYQNKKNNPKTNKINQSSIIQICGKINFKKFLNYIYQNRKEDKIGLDRKYNKFLEGIEQMKKFENSPCRGAIGIEVFNINGEIIGRYKSIMDAARILNLNHYCIRSFLREGWEQYKGFIFKKISPEEYYKITNI